MASYNIRQRDPLLDSRLQAVLQKRGKEMLGIALLCFALMFALLLGSYAPEDPSWMAATDAPVHNSLGLLGAAIASPLMVIAGYGAWGLVLAFFGWGVRFMVHRGEDLLLGRAIFAPIAVAVTSVWAASLVPGIAWSQVFGLGGVFGDTVLGAIISALPMPASAGVNLMTAVLSVGLVVVWGYVLGFVWPEVRALGAFFLLGLVLSYAGLVAILRGGARGGVRIGVRSAQGLVSRAQDSRDRRAEQRLQQAEYDAAHFQDTQHYHDTQYYHDDEPALTRSPRRATPVIRGGHSYAEQQQYDAAQPPYRGEPTQASTAAAPQRRQSWPAEPTYQPQRETDFDAQEAKPSLLARLNLLSRRPADLPEESKPYPSQYASELVEPAYSDYDLPPAGEDRIRARITDVIRARSRNVPPLTAKREVAPAMRDVPLLHREPLVVDEANLSPTSIPVTGWHAAPQSYQYSHPLAGAILPTGFAPAPEPSRHASQQAVHHAMPQSQTGPQTSRIGTQLPQHATPPIAAPMFDPEPLVDAPRTGHVFQRRVVQTTAPRKGLQPSKQARAETQPALQFEPFQQNYELPPLSLLASPEDVQRYSLSDDALEENARMLENVLDDYGVRGEIVSVRPGPVVTMYELEPAPGLKASRVIGLSDDIARSMSALSARVSTVPGRSVIGIELPNAHREKVVLREILAARDFGDSNMCLPLALGKDIGGDAIVANLAKMPHLLIAGTTGSGKSVAINTMILSLLYKLTPAECRMIMIDPKMLELSVYDGIPHLLSPVVTDPKKAVVALKWTVGEMEERYRKMSKMGVRNIEGFNGRVREALERGEMFKRTVQTGFDDNTGDPVFETEEFAPETIPYIVVIVDEMADLMMVAGKEIEACIQRLAQMARASGIHLIMATQRPSVDVITGTIKANFPTRISFQVTSKIDSRTILGEQGAEQLLGMGDMLYMAGGAKITRIHGPFVSDEEVEEIVNHLKSFGPPSYMSGVVEGPDTDKEADIDAVLGLATGNEGEDALYDMAVQIVIKDRKCSTSYIQRKLAIGYNKAARLVEQMEDQGIVTSANHVGKREILVPEQH
jgi:S-DNA-T family DNA segregation ATPase FtsK/SpoIIIE